MVGEKMDSQEILNRLMSAYGVNSQKSLAEALGIPANNISGWLQRDSVPGNPIIKCALDTDTDLRWLVTGEFANANINHVGIGCAPSPKERGKALIEKMLSTGGKTVLQRVMNAYGFATQKELSEYLGISTGTISTWVRREYFPGDVVITCALDTGVALEWLSIGAGEPFSKSVSRQSEHDDLAYIPQKVLQMGRLDPNGMVKMGKGFLPEEYKIDGLIFIRKAFENWLININHEDISNGLWLLDIDGIQDIYTVVRKPGNILNVTGNGASFECKIGDVVPKGVVVGKFSTC